MTTTIQYFNSFEQRETAFGEHVAALIPRKHAGVGPFWQDFKRITSDRVLEAVDPRGAYITSNPRDSLAFSTPRQVLRSAVLQLRKHDPALRLEEGEVARQFDLEEHLAQTVRTLSGGETVKLALARAYIAAYFSTSLTIASPFCWLSRENKAYLDQLLTHYADLKLPVNLLALEGEDSLHTLTDAELTGIATGGSVRLGLTLGNLKIPLGSVFNPMQDRPSEAGVQDFEARLTSPCLLTGQNGQGKSLIAKVLAGAITYQGKAELSANGRTTGSTARLLFQDVITQTMLRDFDKLAASAVSRCNPQVLWSVYEGILDAAGSPPRDGKKGESPEGLLQIKAILTAVRLARNPSAIILDEPDWGLTREAAVAFVTAVISIAHAKGVPVLLISHKPWWTSLARSVLNVSRSAKQAPEQTQTMFTIKLRVQSFDDVPHVADSRTAP